MRNLMFGFNKLLTGLICPFASPASHHILTTEVKAEYYIKVLSLLQRKHLRLHYRGSAVHTVKHNALYT